MSTTVCKPPGLTVFPPHTHPRGDCVLARLLAEQPERAHVDWPPGFQGGIAHRLDTSTSGALLVADDLAELQQLRSAFADGGFRKTYVFQAARDVPWDAHVVEHAIAHDPRRRSRMIVERGRSTPHRGRWYPAHTEFRRLEGLLFEAVIVTGVMHQIRVHAAFVGLALAGDALYGGGEPPEGAAPEAPFRLHHVGLEGPAGRTLPVELPAWAAPARASLRVASLP